MADLGLFLSCVFIWGTTWFAIKFQLGNVDPALSIAYRFFLASQILLVFCRLRGLKLRFSWGDHVRMGVQGTFLFCLSYLFEYFAIEHVTSGLVAVLFSTVIAMNIFNGALFFHQPINGKSLMGAVLGMVGIFLVFSNEWLSLEMDLNQWKGMAFCLVGAFFSSIGTLFSVQNQKRGISVTQGNAYGMMYGSLITFLFVLFTGTEVHIDISPSYLISLFYLTVFGSVLVFGAYLKLFSRMGAVRASYVNILFPVVALMISSLFEIYVWSYLAGFGFVLILLGNYFVLRKNA